MKRALVVGVGGLGCPAAQTLASAGVDLVLADPDRVERTNLHRQPLYGDADVGQLKALVAARRLGSRPLAEAVGPDNAAALFRECDVVLDGTDDPKTKFLLSDVSVATGVPLVYAGVLRGEGQALAIVPGGPCLRCLFEEEPTQDLPCARAGVLGTAAGWVGALQGLMALAVLEGRGVGGRLMRLDAFSLTQRWTPVARMASCPAHPLVDVTDEACPMTYVRTKLGLEQVAPGGILEVLLRGDEPVRNVPRSALEEGHEVVSLQEQAPGRWRLLLRKART